MVWLRRVLFCAALAFLILTFVNAGWLLGNRPGHVRMIANGGIAQDYAPGQRAAPCPARAILPPIHMIFEDTLRAVTTARRMGADLVAIDLARTADGVAVLFPDADLGCRTDLTGPVSGKTLAQLRSADLGYGYTPDNGATYPLRGRGRGLIATLDDVLDADPRIVLVYRFVGNDPAAFDLAVKSLRAHGHDPVALREGFVGNAALTNAAQRAFPGVATLAPDRSQACLAAYRWIAWTGFVPAACQRAGVIVAMDDPWPLWGWPARFDARMHDAGGAVMLVADGAGTGLRHSRQLSDVPAAYRGMVMVDNYWAVGAARRPSLDARTNAEAIAAQQRDDAGG